MYEIWVTSQAAIMKHVLDGIAAFFNRDGGSLMLYVSSVFGFLILIGRYILKPSIKEVMIWLLILMILPFVMIKYKDTARIYDTTEPLAIFTVDHIPFGLLFPLSIITSTMHSVINTAEDALHQPNDPTYTKTGMVYASKLFDEMKSLKPSAALSSAWSEFIYQCIDPNVRVRNRYTYDDLFNAPDMMTFLKDHTQDGFNRVHIPWLGSPSSKDSWPRCLTALNAIDAKYQSELPKFYTTMGAYDPLNKVKTSVEIQNDINGVYGYFLGISSSAQENMMQNLMINATKNGFKDIASKHNQTAAAFNYAYTQNEMSSMASWVTIGMMATEYIPMLQTIVLMILCCAFIPITYLALIPSYTMRILIKYIESIIWVTSWGLFYVFINFIMTSFMSYSVDSFVGQWHGITMSNLDATSGLMSKYAALTGYFLMFTPYLARLVVLGAANTFSGLTTSLQSNIASNAATGARAVATGDVQIGNTNVANHSANNAHFNKQDFDHNLRYGNESMSTLNGGMQSVDAQGNQYHDNRVSGLATHLSQSEAVTRGFQRSIAEHENNAFSANQNAQQSWNAALNTLSGVNENEAIRANLQASHGTSNSMNTDQAYATMVDLAHRYGKDHGYSSSGSKFLEEGGSVSGGFKFFGAGAEGHIRVGHSNTLNSSDNYTDGMSVQDQENYRKAQSVLQSSTRSEIASSEKHFGVDKNHSIQSSLSETKSYSETAAREHRLALDDQRAANYAQNEGSSVQYNDIPQFESWLANKIGAVEANNYLNSPQLQGSSEFKGYVNQYESMASEKFKSEYMANQTGIKDQSMNDINAQANQQLSQAKASIKEENRNNNKVVDQSHKADKAQFTNKVQQLPQGNPSFNPDKPATFNQQKVIPPKMVVSVDEHGKRLTKQTDAIRAEVKDEVGTAKSDNKGKYSSILDKALDDQLKYM